MTRAAAGLKKHYWNCVTKVWMAGNTKLSAEMVCAVTGTPDKKLNFNKVRMLLKEAEDYIKNL
jgi:hypothetical protein